MANGIRIEIVTSEENVQKVKDICAKQMILQASNPEVREKDLDAPVLCVLKEVLNGPEQPIVVGVTTFLAIRKAESDELPS